MTWSSAAAAVAIVASMTYVMRASAILALADRALPAAVERMLRYVGPAVLSALVVSLAAGGEGGPSLELAEGIALVASGAVAWWRRNLIQMLLAGMITLWVLTAVF